MNSPEIPTPAYRRLADLNLNQRFALLPASFYTKLKPSPLPSPYLVGASEQAAALIGLAPNSFQEPMFVDVFSGNAELPSSESLAAVYSGHQFGVWAGQLGDGRAMLLGEVAAAHPAQAGWELQLKGAGKTPYSRMGDGRAVLRSSIREFLCSEAMAGLGIPTSRALCVIGSDMRVMRETPETTAVVTRMAPSFIRFGSFEHWYQRDQQDELKQLADYVLAQSYPELVGAARPYHALLREVTRRTACLVAEWQAVGFMHGVLNTDNMSILGLTLDYGPFGFMEAFDPTHICNHTDQQGRYSYQMQPQIGEWNCYALGQAMLPLIGDVDEVYEALSVYPSSFAEHSLALWRGKLGLATPLDTDKLLVDALLAVLAANRVDFTLFFRQLSRLKLSDAGSDQSLRALFIQPSTFDTWALEYRQRLTLEMSIDAVRMLAMNRVNPKYVLRNYLAQVAIDKAQNKDFSEVKKLLEVLSHPFDEQVENESYAQLPPSWASGLEVSCSS